MFILLIVIPIFFINFLIYTIYSQIILNNSIDRNMQAVEQISFAIESEVKRLIFAAASIANGNKNEIVELVTNWNRVEDSSAKFEISDNIDARLGFLFNFRSDLQAVIFFFRDEGHYFYKSGLNLSEDDVRELDSYQAAVKNKGRAVFPGALKTITKNTNDKYLLSILLSPDVSGARNDVVMIYMALQTSYLDTFYSGFQYNRIGDTIILDENGTVVVSQNKNLMGTKLDHYDALKPYLDGEAKSAKVEVGGRDKMITTFPIHSTHWSIVNEMDYEVITQDISKVFWISIYISVAIVILFFIFSILFFRGILNPVNDLIRKMKDVERGNFDAKIDLKGDGEIRHLGHTFNKMTTEIKVLIAERDLKERQRSQAEIEALQSQINPHFIANTLNSIRLMAMIAKADNIRKMIEAFTKLLSNSFGKGGTLGSAQQEMESLNNYIYIMKVRYGEQFDVQYDIDDQIQSNLMLKMLLQPIVENAILHGVNQVEHKGIITVRGYIADNRLCFEVRDNGVGMTEEQLEQLLSRGNRMKYGFNSIGMRNVDQRIKLNYGQQYGLEVESVVDQYTHVRMILPILTNEDEVNRDV
ncbi:sensor histidine kinase [Paenibacillus sp. N1-5-1-14]|uniref:cache domain-containing sensor histidine kinase n=1 Tax=Paenibacillus radicibacter TaxID=2972488 RepID=UPI00215921F0|nr:sensor histidine kinase [Paenibacillus radicibacter]MCR8643063.1 sensor histidine kinase [Paenibacillus radicibacter]